MLTGGRRKLYLCSAHRGHSPMLPRPPQCVKLTIKVRQVVDVCQYIFWNVSVFFQPKLKNLKGHRFILQTLKRKSHQLQ